MKDKENEAASLEGEKAIEESILPKVKEDEVKEEIIEEDTIQEDHQTIIKIYIEDKPRLSFLQRIFYFLKYFFWD